MKNAVVTGAGSGLGRELCLKLAERKYRILLADVNVAQARESLEMVRKAGGDGEIYACDVTQKEAVEQMARYAFNTFRRVDLLINNAGVTSAGFTGDIPIEDWEWCINIDMWGMIYGCHYFIPQMRTQGGGYIINVASAAGLVCLPEMVRTMLPGGCHCFVRDDQDGTGSSQYRRHRGVSVIFQNQSSQIHALPK